MNSEKYTYLSTHTPNHDDAASVWHELRCFEAAKPCAHDIDVQELFDLGGGIFERDEVLHYTLSSHAELHQQ